MKRKNYIMLLSGTLFGIVLMGIVLCAVVNKVKFENTSVKSNTNEKFTSVIEKINNETEIPVMYVEEPSSDKEVVVKDEAKNNNSSNTNNISTKTNIIEESSIDETIINEEFNIVEYFENKESEIFASENLQKCKQFAKETFVEITDFIFYGTEINGYTFEQLTDEVKIKIMDLSIRLDAKIEQYFPGYKQTIKTDLTNFFAKLTIKYREVTNKICNRIGTETCENTRKGVLLTLDLLEDLSKSSLQTLKTWYEQYRTTK